METAPVDVERKAVHAGGSRLGMDASLAEGAADLSSGNAASRSKLAKETITVPQQMNYE